MVQTKIMRIYQSGIYLTLSNMSVCDVIVIKL